MADETTGLSNAQQEEGLQAARDALAKFSEYYARERDASARTVEMAFRLHEQAISFAEKLILLDGATVALSLTLLGSIISRIGHVPKASFLFFVCPSWAAFLISIVCAWGRMASLHAANVKGHQIFLAHSEILETHQFQLALAPLVRLVHGAAVKDASFTPHQQRLSDVLKLATENSASWEKQKAAFAAEVTKLNDVGAPFGRIALCCTGLGLVMLCIFAMTTVWSL